MFELQRREQSPRTIEEQLTESDAVDSRDAQVEKKLKALFSFPLPLRLLSEIIPMFKRFERLDQDLETFKWYVERRYGWGEGVMSSKEEEDWHAWDTKLSQVENSKII